MSFTLHPKRQIKRSKVATEGGQWQVAGSVPVGTPSLCVRETSASTLSYTTAICIPSQYAYEPGQLSQCRDHAMGRTLKEPRFDTLKGHGIFTSAKFPDRLWGARSPLANEYPELCAGGSISRRVTLTCSAEVDNERSNTSTPCIRFHVVHTHNCRLFSKHLAVRATRVLTGAGTGAEGV